MKSVFSRLRKRISIRNTIQMIESKGEILVSTSITATGVTSFFNGVSGNDNSRSPDETSRKDI